MTEIKEDNVCQSGEWVTENRFKRSWAKLKRNKAALVGGVLILVYVLSAFLAPLLFPGNPSAPNLMESLESPTLKDPLGTDELGRSILGRIIYGSRISLLIAVGVVSVGIILGIPLGLISGYYGGKIDFAIQRVTDTMLAFPGFLLALALVAVLGVGLKNTVISIGISMVPMYIRLVRGCVLSVREEDYVEAARAVGTRDVIIRLRHILP
ncbi:MAG: ABC transporter permease, partial [Desulfobacterales bacterium]|nr:ABC transporter permease [Desulfobacterales bacterium]